ncbi:MAG: pyridoxamine 5'-phosphate oxidase family protein [Cellvibrio sp.]|uniref:pyridoxamine 5'-phosphate oxidase family protein n=1 Tax=Cellvibrio sp. TaxID=1965322 RepID=UPI0031A73503
MFELVESPISRLREKIDPIQFCMMTTMSADHNLLSRPMTHQAIDDDGTLWFFTSDDSQVAEDLYRQGIVNVSFSSPSDNVYVSMSGSALLIKDVYKAKQLWNPMVETWFPQGPNDPHLSLIKFSTYSAEYWDSDTNKMLHLFAMAKAAITGHHSKPKSEHVKFHF